MKPDTYKLIEQCVESGVAYGLTRAYKHTDKPTSEQMKEKITQAVMHEICEWFQFDPRGEA
jgi:hypothetical protein